MSRLRRLAARVPTVVLARRNVARAPARSTLAIVAVIIGVVAIGAIGTGGEAFKQNQMQAYEGFGGTASVDPVYHPGDDPSDVTFSDRDIERMRQAAGGATVLPVADPSGSRTLVRTPSGQAVLTAGVTGIENPGAFYEADAGEIPSNWRRSVVVGSRLAEDHDIEPGDRITVVVAGEFERPFQVAAVLKPQGFADPLRADQTVFVPLGQFEGQTYDQAIVQVDPTTGSVEEAGADIEDEFNVRERTVSVNTVQERRELFTEAIGTMNRFLMGVGAISLLVAAVTIANTMLMSVIERQGEIGVLRAVGYPKLAVVRLLVAESTILGVVGAAIGIPVTLLIGLGINEALVGDPLAFTPTALRHLAVAVGIGVVTALVAGLYPAWRAANMRPVEVLD